MNLKLSERNQKIDNVLAQLLSYEHSKFDWYYAQLEGLDILEFNYTSYLITEPFNADEELRRVFDADMDLCRALLTMLFREDHFNNGSFDHRVERGDVKLIVERMRDLLREEHH